MRCPTHGDFPGSLICPYCGTNEGNPSPITADGLLRDGADAIADRASSRDTESERSMARAVAGFWGIHGNAILERGYMTEADGWQFMVNLKQARAAAGAFREDDWTDQAAYSALGGECAAREAGQ